MLKIAALEYVGLECSSEQDLSDWGRFSSDVLGLAAVATEEAGVDRFKMDERRWRIEVRTAGREGLGYVGWSVRRERDFEEGLAALRDAGIVVAENPSVAEARGARRVATFADPVGLNLELVYGPELDYSFSSPTGARFVTKDLGMGHVVLLVEQDLFPEVYSFYTQLLGFRLSEMSEFAGADVAFLHCNGRHHSLALAPAPVNGLAHFMLEVETLDMVGHAIDRAQLNGYELSASLGRHRNDRMVSVYIKSPGGFDVEYGFDGLIIDPDKWEESVWVGGDVWGHEGLPF